MSQDGGGGGGYELTVSAAAEPLTVLFEPGIGQFELEPGQFFRIVITGPENEGVEFAWAGLG